MTTEPLFGDARERFHVGDHILVRILEVNAEDPEHVTVRADVKSVEGNTSKENMKKCKVQGKYAGTVEDIHKGTVFVRLSGSQKVEVWTIPAMPAVPLERRTTSLLS